MRLLAFFAILLLAPAGGLAQATWYVPDDFATIQGAIDGASNSDTIIVRAGTYYENIDFKGKAIHLTSEDGPYSSIINGYYDPAVTFGSGETASSILDGFTLTQSFGGAVRCDASSPRIAHNLFTDNVEAAICCLNGSSPQILYNDIVDNFGGHGGAIYCSHSSPQILYNKIVGNSADSGGGIYCFASAPEIKHNLIMNNQASFYWGGGIYLLDSPATVSCNCISSNYSWDNGGGIACRSPATIINNFILCNQTHFSGGGIWCGADANPHIANNIICGNAATGECGEGGGGLACYGSATIIANTVLDNAAGHQPDARGGGILCYGEAAVVVANTILWNNHAPLGSEIALGLHYSPGSAVLAISHSDVAQGQSAVFMEPGTTLLWGLGMIDADPLLAAPADNDFHLTWDSPCRGAGDDLSASGSADFEGDPRIAGAAVDIGADEFYYHLYHVGDVLPGTSISLKVVGEPGAGIVLAEGCGIKDPPRPSRYGLIYLEPPVTRYLLGQIPPNGIRDISAVVPATWNVGDEHCFQALLWGSYTRFTNLMTLTVE